MAPRRLTSPGLRRPQVGFEPESFTQVCRDDDVHCLREVEIGTGLSEKVDIGGQAVQEAVGLNCVPARQREGERSGRIQRGAGELLVKWIHAEIDPCLCGEPQVGKTIFPASPDTRWQE
jgi:hypothetical protein